MELDHRLFRSYMERKSEGLVGAIEQGMHTGLFDWEQCEQEPDSVRNYIQDIVLSMVKIHYEVSKPVWSGHWKPVCSRPGLRPELRYAYCVYVVCVLQVYTVSPLLVRRVLCRLVQHIAEEILRVFKEVENFNHNGALHVRTTNACVCVVFY